MYISKVNTCGKTDYSGVNIICKFCHDNYCESAKIGFFQCASLVQVSHVPYNNLSVHYDDHARNIILLSMPRLDQSNFNCMDFSSENIIQVAFSINQSNFYIANIPGEARLSGATAN